MRNILFILILFASSCSAQQPKLYKTTTHGKGEFSAADYAQAKIDAANEVKQVADKEKKRLAFENLQQLYDTLVVGRDVRNLTAAQQKIALGLLLFKNDMVATDFKMK